MQEYGNTQEVTIEDPSDALICHASTKFKHKSVLTFMDSSFVINLDSYKMQQCV